MKKFLKAITVLIFITTIFSCNMDVKEKTTSISGVVKYENAIDHEGINVTLVSTDGLMAVDTSSDRVMDSSSRAIEDFVVTDTNGNYIFKNVREGVYTIYASSNFSKGKAIENNIVVKATSPVTVNELKLTATGSIMGKVI